MESLFLEYQQFQGELAALGAAFLWALSSVIYTLLGQNIPPLKLNLVKGLIAILLIGLTLLIQGQTLSFLNITSIIILLISGAIGVGIGDTAYFAALNHLGARRTLLMETLAPPIAAILALFFFQEILSIKAWCGILLTILGVAWVITERTPTTGVHSNDFRRGLFWGLLAALSQAIGTVLSRYALLESEISPLWSSLIRIVGGVVIVLILMLFVRQPSDKIQWTIRLIGVIILTAFGSTYLGIWLQQISLKYVPVGIAQTLLGTSPLFVLPLAAWMGDKISPRAIFGVVLALAGIWVLFQ